MSAINQSTAIEFEPSLTAYKYPRCASCASRGITTPHPFAINPQPENLDRCPVCDSVSAKPIPIQIDNTVIANKSKSGLRKLLNMFKL